MNDIKTTFQPNWSMFKLSENIYIYCNAKEEIKIWEILNSNTKGSSFTRIDVNGSIQDILYMMDKEYTMNKKEGNK